MSELFIIRGYHWGYNDEVYYPAGNYIKSTFTDETEAKKALIALERKHWKSVDLGSTAEFFDGGDDIIEKADAYIKEKCGSHLFEDNDIRYTFIPENLSDDDFMGFLSLVELEAYKLTRFEESQEFYTLWLSADEDYLKVYDEYSEALVYSESIDGLKENVDEALEHVFEDESVELKGSLEDLSQVPMVLKSLIEKEEELNYDEKKSILRIDVRDTQMLFSVNELLVKPLFEVKTLSLEELLAMEAELKEKYQEEYDY